MLTEPSRDRSVALKPLGCEVVQRSNRDEQRCRIADLSEVKLTELDFEVATR